VTRLTEYYGIVLGIVILFFAIGLRKGPDGFVSNGSRSAAAGPGISSHAGDPRAFQIVRRRQGDRQRLARLCRRFAHGRDRPEWRGEEHVLHLITGALKPDSGQILLNGIDIAGRTPPDIVRHGIGRAFQVASIFPTLTVHETMLAAVCADQRRAAVLHRVSRWPKPATAPSRRWNCWDCPTSATVLRRRCRIGDQKLLDIALALVLEPKSAAARRAHRRDGHRRALAHDRQGS